VTASATASREIEIEVTTVVIGSSGKNATNARTPSTYPSRLVTPISNVSPQQAASTARRLRPVAVPEASCTSTPVMRALPTSGPITG